jgi:methionyl-tRNA synthetase
MARRYLTTTLPYVNADPHVGFALEAVQADTLARNWRLQGDEVFFNTGSDEHGQKILEAAGKAGQEVQAYVDHYAGEFEKLKEALNLSYDAFIRTTDAAHITAAQEMWKRCEAAGDIYKKSYTGLYCVGCESYKTEKELVEGKCVLHPNLTPEQITEENYFFRFAAKKQSTSSKMVLKTFQFHARKHAFLGECRCQAMTRRSCTSGSMRSQTTSQRSDGLMARILISSGTKGRRCR